MLNKYNVHCLVYSIKCKQSMSERYILYLNMVNFLLNKPIFDGRTFSAIYWWY